MWEQPWTTMAGEHVKVGFPYRDMMERQEWIRTISRWTKSLHINENQFSDSTISSVSSFPFPLLSSSHTK